MIRWLEYAGFGAVAVAVHVGIFAARPQSGADAGGLGGDAALSILAVTPTVAEMVETWERPVQAAARAPVLDAPDLPDAPSATAAPLRLADAPNAMVQVAMPLIDRPTPPEADTTSAAPLPDVALETPPQTAPVPAPPTPPRAKAPPVRPKQMATVQPDQPQPADIDTAPPPPPKPKPKSKKKSQKKKPPKTQAKKPKAGKTAKTASAGRAGQKAAGAGGKTHAGTSGKSKVSTLSKGQKANLKAAWGSRIRAKVARNKRYPRGTKASGKVVLALTVGRDGRLRGVSIRRSSGVAALDKAALAAVKRAGRFPSAPKELPGNSFRFNLPITLKK